MAEIDNKDASPHPPVSRRDAFGLGSAALATALVAASSKHASAAPQDSNAAAIQDKANLDP